MTQRQSLPPADIIGAFLRAFHRPAPADAPTSAFRGMPLVDRGVHTLLFPRGLLDGWVKTRRKREILVTFLIPGPLKREAPRAVELSDAAS